MSQVFLSYRHVPRDEELAEGLCAYRRWRVSVGFSYLSLGETMASSLQHRKGDLS